LHATRHRLESLVPLADVAWMAAKWPELARWDDFPTLARQWDCREALSFALTVASRMFGFAVPDTAMLALMPSGWRKRALSRLWPKEDPLEPIEAGSGWERYLFSALTTSWPRGFTGSLVRFQKTRPLESDAALEKNEAGTPENSG
jgi:hypothetical protein